MSEKVFPKGFNAFAPHSNAPNFIKSSVVISIDEAIEWLQSLPNELKTNYKGKDQVKLQLMEGRDGKMYFQVDTYKPKQK